MAFRGPCGAKELNKAVLKARLVRGLNDGDDAHVIIMMESRLKHPTLLACFRLGG